MGKTKRRRELSKDLKGDLRKGDLRKRVISLIMIVCLFLCTGCSSNIKEQSPFAPGEDKKLHVYTSHKKEVYEPIIKEFEERTGIWVEVTAGGTNELLEQISFEEQDAIADVFFGGGVENLEAYSDCFEPYVCEENEMLDETFVSNSNCWTAFSSLPIVIIYNNKLVYDAVAPKGWNDLLDLRWKGKLAFGDPNNSGSCYTTLVTFIQIMQSQNDDVIEKLAEVVDHNALSGSGEVVDAVVKGSKLVGLTLEETAMKQIAAGADISMVYPKEGTSAVPDGSALIKNAPHKENAKQFLNFIVGRDVQQLIVDQFYRRSVRTDVISDLPVMRENIGENQELQIIDYDLEWASSHQNELLKHWTELTK